jgi:hypothetical protein
MNQSGPLSRFRSPFELALQDYEKQTGIELAKHRLAKRLQDCDSVESVVGVLRKRAPALNGGDKIDKIVKALEGIVSVLHTLSKRAVPGDVSTVPVLRVMRRGWVFHISDALFIAVPTCEGNIYWPRYPSCRTRAFLNPFG